MERRRRRLVHIGFSLRGMRKLVQDMGSFMCEEKREKEISSI